MEELQDNIKKMEKLIRQIGNNKVEADYSDETLERIEKLKSERTKLNREQKEEDPKVKIEKKLMIGNAIFAFFGEDIVLNDNFLDRFLKIVGNYKKEIINALEGEK
jgi:ribosome-interacting GTPase 1